MTPEQKYTRTAIWLHWAIAALIGANIILGLGSQYVPDSYVRPMIDLHKSFGITVLLLFFLRLAWRLTHKPPAFPADYKPWESRAAHAAPSARHLAYRENPRRIPLPEPRRARSRVPRNR